MCAPRSASPADLKSYTLCLFAGTASSLIALHAPIDIPSIDGWQLDDDGFGASYRDEAAQSDGVQSARTDANPGGRARIGVKARGTRLANAGLPSAPTCGR